MQKRLEKFGLLSPCAHFPPAGPSYQLQSDKSLIFVSFQTPKKHKVIMFPLPCRIAHVLAPSPLNKCASPDPRLYLPTATLSTRAASPPSTTKTCTTTRISGTCESVRPVQAVYTLGSAETPCRSMANVSIMHLTFWIVLVIVSVPYLTLLTWLISSSHSAEINSCMIT